MDHDEVFVNIEFNDKKTKDLCTERSFNRPNLFQKGKFENPRFEYGPTIGLDNKVANLPRHSIPDRNGDVFSREAFGGYAQARPKKVVTLDSPPEELAKLRPEILDRLRRGEVREIWTEVELF